MGKIARIFIGFLFFLPVLGLFAQRGVGIEDAQEIIGPNATIGKQYALFIAIDAYRSWTPLKKPVSDAQEIKNILQRNYYIDEVIELYDRNATKQNITRTFTDLQSRLGVHDSLFIYYAGHGHYDSNSAMGFWIPVDGGEDSYAQENWLPNSQIRGYIAGFRTMHVFLVSDACFSGDILNIHRSQLPQIDNTYYRRAYALMSRQVMTSGSNETVPDQSEFSAALINTLRKNTAPLLDPIGIYNDVRLSVKSSLPLYGTLATASHQDGATFLFFRKTNVTVDPLPPPPPPPPPKPDPKPAPEYTWESEYRFTTSKKTSAGFANVFFGVGSFTMGDPLGGATTLAGEALSLVAFIYGADRNINADTYALEEVPYPYSGHILNAAEREVAARANEKRKQKEKEFKTQGEAWMLCGGIGLALSWTWGFVRPFMYDKPTAVRKVASVVDCLDIGFTPDSGGSIKTTVTLSYQY